MRSRPISARQTVTRTEQEQKVSPLEEARAQAHAVNKRLPGSLVLVVMLVFFFTRTLTLTQTLDIPPTQIKSRPFGDVVRAMERIETENFTDINTLNALATDPDRSEQDRLVFEHSPLLFIPPDVFPGYDDTFIGVYYLISKSEFENTTLTTIQYFLFVTDESGGTEIRERLAVYGQPIDRELIYRVSVLDTGEVVSSYYQAPIHHLVRFAYDGEERPVFAIASDNHNFRLVTPLELERDTDFNVLIPYPRHEHVADPAHDPDFVALAANEAMRQYHVDLSDYVYVEFQNPVNKGTVTVSVEIHGRWHYLHQQVAWGLTRPGYNQAAIAIGFTPRKVDVETIRIAAHTQKPVDFEVYSVYIYPRLTLLN